MQNNDIKKSDTTRFELNKENGDFSIKVDKGDVIATYRHFYVTPEIEFGAEKTISLKYFYDSLHSAPNVYIKVELANGRNYRAAIDTGYSGTATLTSNIVRDNDIAIWPYDSFGIGWSKGVCQIPEINIGSIKTRDIAAHYTEKQRQYRILNIPVYKESLIFLGMQIIKTFDYVVFDNINDNIVFSKEGAFEPDNSELWQSYPFEIKSAHSLDERIMVQMPINGQVCEVFFDSCGANPGLYLSKDHWQAIEKDMNIKKLADTRISLRDGTVWLCKQARVSEISVAERTFKNADVLIFEKPKEISLLSLGYFQDTVVVLDFVNNLFWIKK
jgi:hypothetical protein